MSDNYFPSGHIPPELAGSLDHVTGQPVDSVQNYHGPWTVHDGIAHRFDPAYDPVARSMDPRWQPPAPGSGSVAQQFPAGSGAFSAGQERRRDRVRLLLLG